MCGRLRTTDRDASDGVLPELERIVKRVRAAWPNVRIIIRGDSGFMRDPIMSWCETNKVEYVLGFAKNKRLKTSIAAEMQEAKRLYQETKQKTPIFNDFRYQTLDSWRCERRIIGKAEYLSQGENPRFIFTSLGAEF